jgi:prephenate dehydrogenase
VKSEKNIFFNKVSIIGVGLLGASFALALRENRLCKTIYGYGRGEDNLKRAKKQGIIDNYTLNAADACENSDLILLATPVGVFKNIIETVRTSFKKGAIVTDVGSVKGGLVYEIDALMPDGVYYIGSHPIAGSDKSGIDDARADLFNNAKCIITPTANSNSTVNKIIISLWESLGAKAEIMEPHKHDEIYAAVSHLPHIVAYAIVNTLGDVNSDYIEYAGQGFKDTTRIALSSPEIWRDISIFNKDNLITLMDIFRRNLDKMEKLLEMSDDRGIEEEFSKAQELRKRLR